LLSYFWKHLFEAHYSDICRYGLFSHRLLEVENEQLQDQLREVRDENCRLYKLLTQKDFEIKQLQKKIQEDRLALSGKPSNFVFSLWWFQCLLDAGDSRGRVTDSLWAPGSGIFMWLLFTCFMWKSCISVTLWLPPFLLL